MEHDAGRTRHVAFLCTTLRSLSLKLWEGVMKAAQDHGFTLETYAGDSLVRSDGRPSMGVQAFSLFSPARFDGIIVYGGAIAQYSMAEDLERFISGFDPVPVCLISSDLASTSSVEADNVEAMRDLARHASSHARGPYACISGPRDHPEVMERLVGIRLGLAEAGTTLMPDGLVDGDFSYDAGKSGIRVLLDERGLRPGHIFCIDDDTALGALDALQERGLRVPEDISLTGFDDIGQAARCIPPLTTVRQSWSGLGTRAVEILARLMEGEKGPLHEKVPGTLMVRQSCGCREGGASPVPPLNHAGHAPGGLAGNLPLGIAGLLRTSYHHSIEVQEDSFTPHLIRLIPRLLAEGHAPEDIGGFIMALHAEGIAVSDHLGFIHALADSAMALLESHSREQSLAQLGGFLVDMSKCQTWSDLRQVLLSHAAALGIALVLVVSRGLSFDALSHARLVAGIKDGKEWDPGLWSTHDAVLSVPDSMAHELGHGSIVLPLPDGQSLSGFVLIRMSAEAMELMELLRMHLSTVSDRIRSLEEARVRKERESAEAEIQAMERVTRTLAHELGTPLGTCVTMQSYLEAELARMGIDKSREGSLWSALEAMGQNLQRMAGIMAMNRAGEYFSHEYARGMVNLVLECSHYGTRELPPDPAAGNFQAESELLTYPEALRHVLNLIIQPELMAPGESPCTLSSVRVFDEGDRACIRIELTSEQLFRSPEEFDLADLFEAHLLRPSAIPASWRKKLSVARNLATYILLGTLEAEPGAGILTFRLTLPRRLPDPNP